MVRPGFFLILVVVCFVLASLRITDRNYIHSKKMVKGIKEKNRIEIKRKKGRMGVERKTTGEECEAKRTKQEDKAIFPERGCVFAFRASFPSWSS